MEHTNALAMDNLFRYRKHAPSVAALLAAEFGFEADLHMNYAIGYARSVASSNPDGQCGNAGHEWEISARSLARRAAHFAIMALDGAK